MKISERSRLPACTQMELPLTVSLPASPAQTFQKPSRERSDLMGSIPAFGLKSNDCLSRPASPSLSSFSKTAPDYALKDWTAFSGHSMRSGMMRNGIVSPLEPLTRRTRETGSGLWPTPTATRRSGLQSHGKNALLGQVNPAFLEWLMGLPIN